MFNVCYNIIIVTCDLLWVLPLQNCTVGPRPDWDPDIVAALDDAIDLEDPDNILEDNFILKVGENCNC